MSRLEVAEGRSGRIGDKQMPAMKWRDRVAIERREPAGTITCRPVGLLGVLTGRQVYAWAVRDAGLSAKHSTLAQTINRQEAGGTLYTTVIFTDQQGVFALSKSWVVVQFL